MGQQSRQSSAYEWIVGHDEYTEVRHTRSLLSIRYERQVQDNDTATCSDSTLEPAGPCALRKGRRLRRAGTTRPLTWAMPLRGTALEIHLRYQIVGELVVYLNTAALRVRHQQAAVHRIERDRGGLGEGPLWLCTLHLAAALEVVRIRGHGHLGPPGELLGVADQTSEETAGGVKNLN